MILPVVFLSYTGNGIKKASSECSKLFLCDRKSFMGLEHPACIPRSFITTRKQMKKGYSM
jgi:hypothetical protein